MITQSEINAFREELNRATGTEHTFLEYLESKPDREILRAVLALGQSGFEKNREAATSFLSIRTADRLIASNEATQASSDKLSKALASLGIIATIWTAGVGIVVATWSLSGLYLRVGQCVGWSLILGAFTWSGSLAWVTFRGRT